jgi:hypothetical protein
MCGYIHPLLIGASGAGYGPVVGSYEHIIEPSHLEGRTFKCLSQH